MLEMTKNGLVLWVTGLSDSGKTTLCRAANTLLEEKSIRCIMLDGDQLRKIFSDIKGYDIESRKTLALRAAKLAQTLSAQGHIVVVGVIALIEEIHDWNANNQENFFLTLLNIPLAELTKRDSKGLYKKYSIGSVSSMYGLDLPADFPGQVDFEITMETLGTPAENADMMLAAAARRYPETQLQHYL